jgi:hypothetical protein
MSLFQIDMTRPTQAHKRFRPAGAGRAVEIAPHSLFICTFVVIDIGMYD